MSSKYSTTFLLIVGMILAGGMGTAQATDSQILPARIFALKDSLTQAIEFWPGFAPFNIPLAIFHKDTTWLYGFPGEVEGFQPGNDGGGLVMRGRHPSIVANSYCKIGEVEVATLLIEPGSDKSNGDWAAIALHESFHVYQNSEKGWATNEANLFLYPLDDDELLTLRREETFALHQAMRENDTMLKQAWLQTALELRKERHQELGSAGAGYEAAVELVEGTATYVEWLARLALGQPFELETILPARGYAVEQVRLRGYSIGFCWAMLLDQYGPGWKSYLDQPSSYLGSELGYTPLHTLFSSPLSQRKGAEELVSDEFVSLIALQARADVDSLREKRCVLHQAFTERSGWKLILEADKAPLWIRGFDPMNVENLGGGEVLHTRYLALGNDKTELKLLEEESLTLTQSGTPLFSGVHMLLITGLEEQPTIERIKGMDRISFAGGTIVTKGAHVDVEGMNVTVVLSE